MASERSGDEALRSIADRLYAGPAAAFTGERAAAAKQARAGGDRDLGARIGALPKPNAAAQLLNALARDAPDELQRVLDLGGELQQAQRRGDRDRLRELGAERRRLLAEVTGRAADRGEGRRPGDAVLEEVQQTLQAAMASEEAAAAVRSGRLVRGLAADGLDPVDLQRAVAVPGEQTASSGRPDRPVPRSGRVEEERRRAERAADEAGRRADGLRAAASATAEHARKAEEEADERDREAAAARDQAMEAQRRHESAERAADAARERAAEARQRADAAGAEADDAEAAAAEARSAIG